MSWLGLLSSAAPLIVRLLTWLGFREDQIKKFLDWVHRQQIEAPNSTLPGDLDAQAREELKASRPKEPRQ